jgi:hypothetical protein
MTRLPSLEAFGSENPVLMIHELTGKHHAWPGHERVMAAGQVVPDIAGTTLRFARVKTCFSQGETGW